MLDTILGAVSATLNCICPPGADISGGGINTRNKEPKIIKPMLKVNICICMVLTLRSKGMHILS